VDDCLNGLIPPRDLGAARSLALAGRVVLDHLPRDLRGLSPAAARACVMTAVLINSPSALDLLARYASDARSQVQAELIEGWRYFELKTYARRVLASRAMTDDYLVIHTAGQLQALHDLPPQRYIAIRPTAAAELGPLLRQRESLVRLILPDTPIEARRYVRELTALPRLALLRASDVSFLAELRELTDLFINDAMDLADFSPLWELPKLWRLVLFGAPHLTSWNSVPRLDGLRQLALLDVPAGRYVGEIVERAPMLTRLDLTTYEDLADLETLARLSLDQLVLWAVRNLQDIAPLSGCHSLTSLDLGMTSVDDLGPLTGLTRLSRLSLQGCPNLEDLSPLAELTDLRVLRLADAAPGLDLGPLAGNPHVEVHIAAGQDVRNGHLLGRRLKRVKPRRR
jgi:hypothetical protein